MDSVTHALQVEDSTTAADERTSWAGPRRWRLPAAALAGLVTSGVLLGTVSATAGTAVGSVRTATAAPATQPTPPADTAASPAADVEAAVLDAYPGATVLAIAGNLATGYVVRLATPEGELMALRVVLGAEEPADEPPATGTAEV
ncbi:MAG TPA: hypothetical protein VF661_11905 [Actinomycetales bacterium]|jgi:hypothetical protein